MTNLNHSITALILDMDGVLWRGDQPIGDLPAVFAMIERIGLKYVLATNNALRSTDQFVEKLFRFGVQIRGEQIVNSAQATAHYLQRQFPEGGRVFIVGEEGLHETLAEFGFHHSQEKVVAVVAGLDRMINYEKIAKAALLIRAGALFVGTNPDNTYPTPSGLMPGAGTVLAAIQAAAESEPVIIGKPQPEMYRVALERLKVAPEQTLVVGDRLATDIAGAQAIGCQTALVLSGVTDEAAAREWRPPPDYIVRDLTVLLENLG